MTRFLCTTSQSARCGLFVLLLCCVSLGGLGLTTPAAWAQSEGPPPPKHRVYYDNLTAARYNPTGLLNQFSLLYRYRLMRTMNPFLADTYIGAGITTTITPAFGTIGAEFRIQPASLFQIMARYEFIGYFGTFGQLDSFATPATDFGFQARTTEGSGNEYATIGSLLTVCALLQAKFGPFAFRDRVNLFRYDMDLHGNDSVFYNQYIDYLVKDGGFTITNDLDLFYLADFGLLAGARYSLGIAFHDDSSTDAAQLTQRVGPVLGWRFFDEYGAAFNQPTLLLLVQWWLSHPYRTGDEVSQGIPYIALAFSFNGDLWTSTQRN